MLLWSLNWCAWDAPATTSTPRRTRSVGIAHTVQWWSYQSSCFFSFPTCSWMPAPVSSQACTTPPSKRSCGVPLCSPPPSTSMPYWPCCCFSWKDVAWHRWKARIGREKKLLDSRVEFYSRYNLRRRLHKRPGLTYALYIVQPIGTVIFVAIVIAVCAMVVSPSIYSHETLLGQCPVLLPTLGLLYLYLDVLWDVKSQS